MSAIKAGGINTVLAGAAFTAFLGFGWCINFIDGQPAEVVGTWMSMWGGVASITLAIALVTFFTEIADHLEAKMTPTRRGRYSRTRAKRGRHARR